MTASSATPMKILLATDGSPFSEEAARSVAARPWPAGSQVEILTVAYTRVPFVPEPTAVAAAAHVEAKQEDARRAPERLRAAERIVAEHKGLSVETKVLEGDPRKTILDEAAQWHADLVVVGSHGYGGFKRLVLGSVSEAVARYAPCSVEIVRARGSETA